MRLVPMFVHLWYLLACVCSWFQLGSNCFLVLVDCVSNSLCVGFVAVCCSKKFSVKSDYLADLFQNAVELPSMCFILSSCTIQMNQLYSAVSLNSFQDDLAVSRRKSS